MPGARLRPARVFLLAFVGVALAAGLGTAGPSAESWRADYETGDFSQWKQVQPDWRQERAAIVTLPVRAGRHAARFEVRSGDTVPSGGELSQVYVDVAKTGGTEGEEWYYAWSTYIPSGQRWASTENWNVVSEWHHDGSTCYPPLQLGVFPSNPPQLYVSLVSLSRINSGDCTATQRKKWFLPLIPDRWMDFVFHVRWSSKSDTGSLEVWQDGKKRIVKTSMPTLFPEQGVYFKQGFYRTEAPFTNVVLNDEVRRVSELRELPRFQQPEHLESSFAALRNRIERSGRSWEEYLSTHAALARNQGVAGVTWSGRRFFTKTYLAEWLAARGTTFEEWASARRHAAAALDWHATTIPYAEIVGRPLVQRDRIRLRIRSALAETVSIVVRDASGGRLGTVRVPMPESGFLTRTVSLLNFGGDSVDVRLITTRGDRRFMLKTSLPLR